MVPPPGRPLACPAGTGASASGTGRADERGRVRVRSAFHSSLLPSVGFIYIKHDTLINSLSSESLAFIGPSLCDNAFLCLVYPRSSYTDMITAIIPIVTTKEDHWHL